MFQRLFNPIGTSVVFIDVLRAGILCIDQYRSISTYYGNGPGILYVGRNFDNLPMAVPNGRCQ